MKITSGILRNRQYNAPDQEVRPTKGQVREAIFSSLGGHCLNLNVLDLFAGAGGLGLEAWSRGAKSVTFVEQHPVVWKNLNENIKALKNDELGAVHCIKGDALKYPERAHSERFDLITIDPPYDLTDALEIMLAGIKKHSVLTPDGKVVYELRSNDAYELSPDWELLRDKVYGYTRVLVLKERI